MEFYVKDLGDPNFQDDKLQLDDDLSMLLTQIEVILFTKPGDVLGRPDFGADLESYVYEFRYNDYQIKNRVLYQIDAYAPLAQKYPIEVDVSFTENASRYVMFIDITVDARLKLGVFV